LGSWRWVPLALICHVNGTVAPPKGPADGRGHRKRGDADAGGLSREGRSTQLNGLPCGSDGCAMTPLGGARDPERRNLDLLRGRHARQRLCRALVRRVEGRDGRGVFQVRDDEPAPRVGSGLHRIPWERCSKGLPGRPRPLAPMRRAPFSLALIGPDCLARFGDVLHLGSDLGAALHRPFKASLVPIA
jgi:hypothetical protein